MAPKPSAGRWRTTFVLSLQNQFTRQQYFVVLRPGDSRLMFSEHQWIVDRHIIEGDVVHLVC
jgi:hypothetical protein